VRNPGKLQEEHPITVTQALAQAGGVDFEGTIEHVKVLFLSEDNKPIMRTVNLKRVMEQGRLEEDVVLPDNSIVFVPRTGAAKVGKWVDEYIRRILMWNGEGFNINYEINND
jgi:protein involved in polysaccharide export with SLBB domain